MRRMAGDAFTAIDRIVDGLFCGEIIFVMAFKAGFRDGLGEEPLIGCLMRIMTAEAFPRFDGNMDGLLFEN